MVHCTYHKLGLCYDSYSNPNTLYKFTNKTIEQCIKDWVFNSCFNDNGKYNCDRNTIDCHPPTLKKSYGVYDILLNEQEPYCVTVNRNVTLDPYINDTTFSSTDTRYCRYNDYKCIVSAVEMPPFDMKIYKTIINRYLVSRDGKKMRIRKEWNGIINQTN